MKTAHPVKAIKA